MILEWDNPWELQTPQGTLPLNAIASSGTTPLGYYMLDPSKCAAGAGRRITRSSIPQAGGEITHRKFKTGYVVELHVQLWEAIGDAGVPACGSVLREMGDLLELHLNSIENDDGRLVWTPSASPAINDRMVDKARILGPSGSGDSGFVGVTVEKDPEGPLVVVTFALLSPLPYAMDAPQTTTNLGGSTPVTVTNDGNVEFFPVFKVYGATSSFTLVNNSNLDEAGNPKQFVYSAALPGALSIAGGDYAEIDTFRNTVYLNGNSSNLKPGIDIPTSDFWGLVPGDNDIEIFGASADMLWQAGWA